MRIAKTPVYIQVLAVVAILAILWGILTSDDPSRSRRHSCKNNLKNIGLLCMIYAQDYGTWPSDGTPAFSMLFKTDTCDNLEIFICTDSKKTPGDPIDVDNWTDYKYLPAARETPGSVPLIYCQHCRNTNNGYTNIWYGDGHVSWDNLEDLDDE